jgi:hypothetical protein
MEVKYAGSIQDMITEYDTLNVKAGITGVAYRTMLMKGLPQQIFKQLTTVNPADKTDNKLREIILTAGKNIEIWQTTKKNFGMMNRSAKSTGRISEVGRIQKRTAFEKPRRFESNKTQYKGKARETPRNFKSPGGKTYAQMIEGVSKNEIDRSGKECIRCASPSDRKGAHRTMKCFPDVKVTSGTADFVKPRTYQKLKVGGFNQLEDEAIDEYEITSDDGEEGQVQTSEGKLPTEVVLATNQTGS